MFEQIGWGIFADKLGISGPRENWLTIARYVDDIIVASRWFCPTCIEHIVKLIYARTITFDKECAELATINGFTTVKFLDLWCYMSWESHFFALVNKNDLYSISGLISLETKKRFPIPYGDTHTLLKRITSDLRQGLKLKLFDSI